MAFSIKIESEAKKDIQDGIIWYNKQQIGLGKVFHAEVKAHFKKLQLNPFFQVRYDNVRCLPLNTFPYMIHFTINKELKLVVVYAVFNTLRNPENLKDRT